MFSLPQFKFPLLFKPAVQSLPQHEILRRLNWMRLIALACQLAGIVAANLWLSIALPMTALLGVLGLLVLVNLWSWRRLRNSGAVGQRELFCQLLIDVLALSLLLYFCGGATNPFVSFFLPTLAVAAAVLPWRYSLLLALCSLACYSLMTAFYVPLRVADVERAVTYHLTGMWANFALSAALITWFVGRLSWALRERDAQLAASREWQMQHARVVALATQAASAAHEMGTPLSTIAMIAGELRRDRNPALAAYADDLQSIEAQIALCKKSLDRISARADRDAALASSNLPLQSFITQLIDDWRLRQPAVGVTLESDVGSASIAQAPVIEQILMTLLDNAARAGSLQPIDVSVTLDTGAALICVRDHGVGIEATLLRQLGTQTVSSTTDGQGNGLLLAFVAARQIGAQLTLDSKVGNGTLATLRVVLA